MLVGAAPSWVSRGRLPSVASCPAGSGADLLCRLQALLCLWENTFEKHSVLKEKKKNCGSSCFDRRRFWKTLFTFAVWGFFLQYFNLFYCILVAVLWKPSFCVAEHYMNYLKAPDVF